jgi:hypothetical protein
MTCMGAEMVQWGVPASDPKRCEAAVPHGREERERKTASCTA